MIGVVIGTLTSLRVASRKKNGVSRVDESRLNTKAIVLKYTTYALASIALLVAVGAFLAISSIFGNPFDEGNGEAIKNARVALGASFAGSGLLLKVSGLIKALIFFSLFTSVSLSIYFQSKFPVLLVVALVIASILYDASVGSRTLLFDYLVLSFFFFYIND